MTNEELAKRIGANLMRGSVISGFASLAWAISGIFKPGELPLVCSVIFAAATLICLSIEGCARHD